MKCSKDKNRFLNTVHTSDGGNLLAESFFFNLLQAGELFLTFYLLLFCFRNVRRSEEVGIAEKCGRINVTGQKKYFSDR